MKNTDESTTSTGSLNAKQARFISLKEMISSARDIQNHKDSDVPCRICISVQLVEKFGDVYIMKNLLGQLLNDLVEYTIVMNATTAKALDLEISTAPFWVTRDDLSIVFGSQFP